MSMSPARRLFLAVLLVIGLSVAALPSGFAPEVAIAGTWTNQDLKSVAFVDANIGYSAGVNTIMKTTDGGASWSVAWSSAGYDLRGVAANGTSVWAVDRAGAVVWSTNSGATWNIRPDVVSVFYDPLLNAIDGFHGSAVFAAGTHVDGPPAVYRSGDGGQSFDELSGVTVMGDYPWPTDPDLYQLGFGEFYGVDFLTSARGWAVGHDAYLEGATRHNDGIIWDYDTSRTSTQWGAWEKRAAFPGSGPLYGVSFFGETAGIAVGAGGRAYYTTDAGETWTAGITGTTANLRAVAVAPGSSTAWAVGDGGVIIKTADNGATWTSLTSGTGVSLRGIASRGGTSAVAVGLGGTILSTTDGVNWATPADPPTVTALASSTHPSDSAWYAATTASFTWSSATAGGYSYAFDQSPTTTPDTTQDTASASASVGATSDGAWWFHVRGVKDGVWGPAVHRKVQIDTTAPTLTASNAKTAYTSSASIGLSGADTGGSGVTSIRYSLGGPETTVSGASATVTAASPGTYTLVARSYDAVGNASAPYELEFTVYPPATVLSIAASPHSDPQKWYPSGSTTLSWTSSTSAGYSFVLDRSSSTVPETVQNTTATSSVHSDLADGVWWFHVRGINAAGDWGDTKHFRLQVDTTSPTVTSDAIAAYWGSATIAFGGTDGTSSSGVASLTYQLDGAAPVQVAGSGKVLTTSAVGPHTLVVTATDAAGNTSAPSTMNFTVNASTKTFVSLAGTDRFGTSVKISQKAYPAGASTVVIATGYNWPDALGGAALAKAYGGPILLVKPNGIPAEVMNEIVRLKATKAIILGGPASVSSGVERTLDGRGLSTPRIAGANRYETSRKVAADVKAKMGAAFPGTAFVATGHNFPDALAGSPLSAAWGWPIYLVGDSISGSEITTMKNQGVKKVVILGGSTTVSSRIESSLRSGLGSVNVQRQAGTDRYETAIKVATLGVAEGLKWDKLALSTGTNFPDALAGGALQGKDLSVMLLTPTDRLDGRVSNLLKAKKASIGEVRYIGGTESISRTVRNAVSAALSQ